MVNEALLLVTPVVRSVFRRHDSDQVNQVHYFVMRETKRLVLRTYKVSSFSLLFLNSLSTSSSSSSLSTVQSLLPRRVSIVGLDCWRYDCQKLVFKNLRKIKQVIFTLRN